MTALRDAALAGDVAAVRVHAKRMLEEHPGSGEAAGALLWCGDFAEALRHLPPQEHTLRARAHALLGQIDEAGREIEMAIAENAPMLGFFRDPNLQYEVTQFCDICGSAGLPVPFMPKPKPFKKLRESRFARLLREGHWDLGMALFKEWNFKGGLPPHLDRVRSEPLPLWRGRRVGHLVVIANVGNGDFFQFGRYVTLARERCSRLSLVVSPRLEAIAKRCLPVDAVVHRGKEWPVVEVANAYTSLELWPLFADALGVQYANPWQIAPPEGSVPYLPPWEALHVGLCWSASPTNGVYRSIPFASMEPLQSLPGALFHSLQVGASANDAEEWVERHELRTYDDTVSLIAALDAVVTVDTSVAHLAANVGKPVHLILADYEDWRWGTGETTPWYPTMRIYRGDVGESVKRVTHALGSQGA